MGMSASQARLLAITARIHDVEQQAQSIQNAKIQLATQSDRAYSEYLEALDATTMTVRAIDDKSGATSVIPANFNNLCSINRVYSSTGEEYALQDSQGRLIVSDDVYEGYQKFMDGGLTRNGNAFALFMLGLEDTTPQQLRDAEEAVYQNIADCEENPKLVELRENLEKLSPDGDIYSENSVKYYENDPKGLKAYQDAFDAYINELYSKHSENIYKELTKENPNAEEFDQDKFNYYSHIFNQIQAAGGCVSIEMYNGINGDAANDTDWLQAMVKAGKISIHIVDTDKNTGHVTFDGTSVSSDSSLEYTETTSIDSTALAKAEAKYEKALKDINQKDKQFDLSLSQLDTERNALTTEYDSVKKVISDNIERTFGIFS